MSIRDEVAESRDDGHDPAGLILPAETLSPREVRELRRVFRIRTLGELDFTGQLRAMLFVMHRRGGLGHRRAYRSVRDLGPLEAKAQIELMSTVAEQVFGLSRPGGVR